MTIYKHFTKTLGATILGITVLVPQQALAGLLNDVYNKANAAYLNAVAGVRETRGVRTVVNGVNTKIDNIQSNLGAIPDLINKFPDPLVFMGDTRDFLEENVANSVGMMIDMKEDFVAFKSDDCDLYSECGQLRAQLVNIRQGLKNIRNLLPIKDILPPAQAEDPVTRILQGLPPISLYAMNTALGDLSVLDTLEDDSEWLASLRLYKLTPLEDVNSRTCMGLRSAMQDENYRLKKFKTTMHLAEKVFEVLLTAVPKDVVVSVLGEGTNVPSPIYPMLGIVKMVAGDAKTFVSEELAARKEQANDCSQFEYQMEVRNALQELLAR